MIKDDKPKERIHDGLQVQTERNKESTGTKRVRAWDDDEMMTDTTTKDGDV